MRVRKRAERVMEHFNVSWGTLCTQAIDREVRIYEERLEADEARDRRAKDERRLGRLGGRLGSRLGTGDFLSAFRAKAQAAGAVETPDDDADLFEDYARKIVALGNEPAKIAELAKQLIAQMRREHPITCGTDQEILARLERRVRAARANPAPRSADDLTAFASRLAGTDDE